MADPLKWDTRLVVKVDNKPLTLVDSFNPMITVPVQPLHSLEADNVAHFVQPATFTFTMAVKAVGPNVAMLTDLARKRAPFTVALMENSGDDWAFDSVTFNDCYITSVANTIVIDGVPTTTFNCICLQVVTVDNT